MQYLSPLVFCVLPTLEYESSFLQTKFTIWGEFWYSYFFSRHGQSQESLSQSVLKKRGVNDHKKLKQNFNSIKFNFIFSKQQTHYRSHCEVQGYKRLRPPRVTCKEPWVCSACPRAGDGARRDARLEPTQGHHPRVRPVGGVTATLPWLGPRPRGKETSVVFPKLTQKIKYNKWGEKRKATSPRWSDLTG